MSIDYFQRFLQAYDGDSKEVREQLNNAIMREKMTPMVVADWLLEGLEFNNRAEIEDCLKITQLKIYRQMELNNLRTVVKGYLEMPEIITDTRIASIMRRIYELILNKYSSGKHELTKL